jgi:hypothetical protein
MWVHVAAGATNERTCTELAQAPSTSEQPSTQNASQAEDARSKQQDAGTGGTQSGPPAPHPLLLMVNDSEGIEPMVSS